MFQTNLKILLTVVGTLAVYTAVANMIPQVESEVPEELTLGSDVTPEQLAEIGERLYDGTGGCTVCHGLGTRAPDLLGVVGTGCATRRPGLSCKDYLLESLVQPAAFVVEGFQPIMPDMTRTLSPQQIWALVAFLESQGGTITVTVDDIPSDEAPVGTEPGGAAPATAAPALAATDGEGIINALGCLACHQPGSPLAPTFAEIADKDREYVRRSILAPAADTAAGYEAFAGTMPTTFGEQLSAAQLETLLDYILSR